MKIAAILGMEVGKIALVEMLKPGHEVVAVIAIDENSEIAKTVTKFATFDETCYLEDIPLYKLKKFKDLNTSKYIDLFRKLKPDVVFVIGWSGLIKKELLETTDFIGQHPSLLIEGKYRGGAPVAHQLMYGETESAVTFFHMTEGIDKGDIVCYERFPIGINDNSRTVMAKIEKSTARLVRKILRYKRIPSIPQTFLSLTPYHRRKPEDSIYDRELLEGANIEHIHNLIRALTLYAPLVIILGDKKLTFENSIMMEDGSLETICRIESVKKPKVMDTIKQNIIIEPKKGDE